MMHGQTKIKFNQIHLQLYGYGVNLFHEA